MMASLLVAKGPAAGEKISLERHRMLTIGRDAQCSIQIVDPQLSRIHLKIEFSGSDSWHYAIDHQSKNGVFVNDRKITEKTPLKDHDRIGIGNTVLVYYKDDSPLDEAVLELLKRSGQGNVNTRASGSFAQ